MIKNKRITMNKRSSFKRWHPYLNEWVIFAPVTAVRPWNGKVIKPAKSEQPEFDPACYLCPNVQRANGEVNPDYRDIFTFTNDFSSLSFNYPDNDLIQAGDTAARGICKVVCFSHKHNLSLPLMSSIEILKVIDGLYDEFKKLSSIPEIENVMMFENKGTVIGVSNPHPHGQIYATDFIPRIPLTMYTCAKRYMDDKQKCLFCAVMDNELCDGKRLVCQNSHFIAFIPSFARFTYEVHIVPLRHVSYITELSHGELQSLAEIYREVLIRYDNLFQTPFPNITIFYNAPCSEKTDPKPFHFHIEFYPPMRSPDKLKYLAGFESGGGNIINPSVPFESAESLRSVSDIHYSNNLKET